MNIFLTRNLIVYVPILVWAIARKQSTLDGQANMKLKIYLRKFRVKVGLKTNIRHSSMCSRGDCQEIVN